MKLFLLVLFIIGFVFGCDSRDQDYVNIKLKDKRLEDVTAGKWLKEFEIDYNSSSPPKTQILERLLREGEILAKYHKGRRSKNREHIVIVLWQDHTFLVEEYLSESKPSDLWISLLLHDKPCNQFLDGDKVLDGSGDNLHKATITASADHARLFLFGIGATCERISLF